MSEEATETVQKPKRKVRAPKSKKRTPTAQAAEGKPVRTVVVPRPIDPSADFTLIRNRDPNQHYVLVNQAHEINRARYRAYGYQPVESRPGGPQPMYEDVPTGQTVEIMGQVLMSVPKDHYDAMQQAGQEQMDAIMKRINSQETIDSEVRPVTLNGKRILDVRNDSQAGI